MPLSLVWFGISAGGSWAASLSPLGGFWIQGLCRGKRFPRGGDLPHRLARAWTRPQAAAPRPGKVWVWAGSTMKGRRCCTSAPCSGALALPHGLSSNSPGLSVSQFPCKEGESMWGGGCSRLGLWQGKGRGGAARKGSGSGSPRVARCQPPLALVVPLKIPLNNSSAFKLGWRLWRPACVVSPALVAPPCHGGRAGHPIDGTWVKVFPPARDVLGSWRATYVAC